MILGYGIIAIPTGIVSSEMTKAGNEKKVHTNTQCCTNCLAEKHKDHAEFCYKCGCKLHNN
jgi:voltage-gated potassium channel